MWQGNLVSLSSAIIICKYCACTDLVFIVCNPEREWCECLTTTFFQGGGGGGGGGVGA